MTHGAETPAPAPPRQVRPYLQLERLEYGKYCISRTGAIESGLDHMQLGHTEDFPAEIVSQCDPEIIGVAHNMDEDPFAPAPYGTVLRPVRIGNRLVSVMARVRMRPEDGENGTSRRYTLARYLVSPDDGPTPEQMLHAMNRLPLFALTRAEAAAGLAPLRIAQPGIDATLARQDPAADAFLVAAVDYALSAVPITIVDDVDEATFFDWVTRLWHLLPASTRPLLSAGWNVAPSLSGELLVTRSPAASPTSARYVAASQRWAAPQRIELRRNATRLETTPFAEERLVPGRSITFLHSTGLRPEHWFAAPPPFDFPSVPDLRDPITVRALRWPGLRLADDFRRRRISQWFQGGAAVDLEQERAAGDFIYDDTQRRAVEDLLGALAATGIARERADEYVSRLGENDGGAWLRQAIAGAVSPGSARARLLIALRGPATDAEVMNALAEATLANEARDLREPAASALTPVLDRHLRVLDETGTGIHRRLLLSNSAPAEYGDWARQNEVALLLTIGKWPAENRLAALERLLRDGSPALQPVGRWLRGHPPSAGDAQTVATLPAESRELFARALASAWCHAVDRIAERRVHVLAWFNVETPHPPESALLRFALGHDNVSRAEVAEVVEDVERRHAPAALNERLAVFAVAHWPDVVRSLRGQTAAWDAIIDWWPRPARRLLLDIDRESPAPAPANVVEALNHLELTADEVEEMTERWSGWQERANDAPLAEQLWRFAAAARVANRPRLRSVEIVHELVSRHFSGVNPVDAIVVARALDLVSVAGVGALDAAALWQTATLPWQLVLLLRIFPSADLQPSVPQLEALARERTEIDAYFRETVPQARFNLLEIVALGFHSIDFRTPATTAWRDDYRNSFLWAVFRHVPLDQQGSLRAALDFYTRDARARVDRIREYLDAAPANEREESQYRALRDGVFPMLARVLTRRETVDVLRHLNERREPPAGVVARSLRAVEDFTRWIRRRPVISSSAATTTAVTRHGRRVVLADWLYDVLRTHLAVPAAQIERAGHDFTH